MLVLLFLDYCAPIPLFFVVHDIYLLVLFIQVSSYSPSRLGHCFPFADFNPLRGSSRYPCWIRTLVPGGLFVFCTPRVCLFVTVLMTPWMGSITFGGFIIVPLMGRIKDLKIKLIELRS